MSSNPLKLLTFATEKEKNSSVNLKSLFAKYLYHWPIILATTVVMLIMAYGYIQITDPVYVIKATLLVNADKSASNQSSDGGQSVLNKIDLPNSAEIVENELAKLKSA